MINKSDNEFWEKYYKNIEKDKKDFLKDSWMEKYIDLIMNVKNKNAIDLGCGMGQDSYYLSNKGFDVVSCDMSLEALKSLSELYPNLKTLKLDLNDKLPFEKDSYGLVLANLSLHYFTMEKTKEIFKNIYEILEDGGLFIGRMNSDKNDYVNDDCIKIEENLYYNIKYKRHRRMFNKSQFDELSKEWKVIILNEDKTVRCKKEKYTWEFIFKKER